jgi:hypothetical protein
VGPVADAPIRWLYADYWLQRFRANAGPADAAPLLRLVVQIGSNAEMVAEARKHLEEIERISPP